MTTLAGDAAATHAGVNRAAASATSQTAAATYTLRLADDCLILSHRLAEWSSRAPTLEEDVALTNIGLDLLGQARALYTHAAELDGTGRSEDDYAYLRDEREFTNCQLVEQENGDFATTVVRQLLFSTFQHLQWQALVSSTDTTLAAIAAKAVKESAYHVDHASQWTRRLGDGTLESHERMDTALDALMPYAAELFVRDALIDECVSRGVAADPVEMRPSWDARVDAVLDEATLQRPSTTWEPGGGRDGIHTESFGYMLAEMQYLHRSHPGAKW